MRQAEPRKVAIVDDHPLVRDGLRFRISSQRDFEICGEAESIEDATRLIKQRKPDLVTVDLRLRDGHGIDLIKQVREFDSSIKILVVSIYDDDLYAERVLKAGASGYVNKREVADVLLTALRQVLAGKIYLSSQMTEKILKMTAGGSDGPGSVMDDLTDRELEIFELIGQGFGSREIADRLFLSCNTIDTYRERIKKKLELKNGNQLTRFAIQWLLEQGTGAPYREDPGRTRSPLSHAAARRDQE